MSKKLMIAALTALMLVAVVATGIHVLNKEARAAENHVMWVKFANQEETPCSGLTVTIYVKTGPGDEDWSSSTSQTDALGKFSYSATLHSTATYWIA